MGIPPQLKVAQEFYQAYLRLNGIEDPEAFIEYNLFSGYVGRKGVRRMSVDERFLLGDSTNRAYDIIPSEIAVEINRKKAGLAPLDQTLVDRLFPNGFNEETG